MKTLNLALGGGGVKGLAHIALLKFLDRLQRRPDRIAGTSMGAIIAALYASGLSGEEIEARVRDHIFSRSEGFRNMVKRRSQLVKWVKVFTFEGERGGFVSADGLFEHLFTEIRDCEIEELPIPFCAVACDFHRAEKVALDTGSLLDAVRASMAVPGVFAPVRIGARLLVDGGLVENVPCADALGDARDLDQLLIASDVISLSEEPSPNMAQVLSGALSIMLRSATHTHYREHDPAFIFRPDTEGINAFDFHKISEVLERGEAEIVRQADRLHDIFS